MALEQFAPSPLSHFDPADLLDVPGQVRMPIDGGQLARAATLIGRPVAIADP